MTTVPALFEAASLTHPDTSQPAALPPAAPPAKPEKLRFAASRATRHAGKALDRAKSVIYEKQRDCVTPRYDTPEAALRATLAIPQYRRTYIQGCACATGIAGGGCCPGNAMGSAAQAGAGQTSNMAGMLPADLAIGALGAYGMYSGYTVARNAYGALQHLQRVERDYDPRLARESANAARLAQHGPLIRARAAAQQSVRAMRAEKRDLRTSIREQQFNIAVPGLLQLSAATCAVVATVGHLTRGCLGVIGGTAVGTAASGLFALYGGALAVKNFSEYAEAKKLSGLADDASPTGDAETDAAYRAAVAAHLKATRTNKLVTGIAWTAVCAAAILGTLVTAGAVAFPGALPVVLGIGLAAGLWAMWQNSRTRYVPHMPVSPHVERADIDSTYDRAVTWTHLSRQDAAIKQAVAQMTAVQRRRDLLEFHAQRLFRPQCGPRAFTVLAKSVQTRRGDTGVMPAAHLQAYYERTQLEAVKTWCDNEKALLTARYRRRSDVLQLRYDELRLLTTPRCKTKTRTAEAALQPGAPTEAVYTDAARSLEAEAFDLERDAERLAGLEALQATLASLDADVGALGTPVTAEGQTPTPAQHRWAVARVQVLQLSGALSDALSKKFVDDHQGLFETLRPPEALPINNVHLLGHKVDDFIAAIAPELDGAFVHAFFNPRRIEGEMDFIIERELKEGHASDEKAGDVAEAASKINSDTCCR